MSTFHLDHDVHRGIALTLRRRGHTVSTAYEEGLAAAADDEQFVAAVQRSATLITHNFDDFKLLHGAWFRWATLWGVDVSHRGILVIPQRRWTPNEAAGQIANFVDLVGNELHNRMFRWRPSTGWYEVG